MQKLTLSVHGRVVERAKRYARDRGTSVSRLVETYLDMLAEPLDSGDRRRPVLMRLRGSMTRGTIGDFHRYLERKYR
ncbi:MAG: DUF6364 family protein [Vicinamibacterales bacterium]